MAEQTGLHQRAIAGIGAFLQNEEYAPNISRTIYENDRYRVEGPGFLFRVNATLGEVVTDDLVREEAVSAFNQSDDYPRVREVISNTT